MVFGMYAPFMQDPFFGPTASALGFGAVAFSILLLVITVWSLAWKALGLYHAARNKQRLWFIAILLFNTVGVLEIVYLAWFRKDVNEEGATKHLFPFLAKLEARVRAEASSAGASQKKDTAEEKKETKTEV